MRFGWYVRFGMTNDSYRPAPGGVPGDSDVSGELKSLKIRFTRESQRTLNRAAASATDDYMWTGGSGSNWKPSSM